MKRIVSILSMAALLAVLVPACNKTTPEKTDEGKDDSGKVDPDPTPTPATKADYTILYYGIGGGNLDIGDEDTIKNMAQALDGENCNVRIINIPPKEGLPKKRNKKISKSAESRERSIAMK